MTTPRIRAIVSLAATLVLGACASATPPATWDGAPTAHDGALAFRFDNEAREYVHVYLIGDRREWLLGRVDPGGRATLRIPAASLTETTGFLRLAVIEGGHPTVLVARDPRATLAVAQPVPVLLSQRWTFSGGQLAAPQLFGAPAGRAQR